MSCCAVVLKILLLIVADGGRTTFTKEKPGSGSRNGCSRISLEVVTATVGMEPPLRAVSEVQSELLGVVSYVNLSY